MAKTSKAPRKPFHEVVAERLIEQLKEGTAPWQKPWKAGAPGTFLPTNPVTGKRYNGINIIQLLSQGYEDSRWMTYNQAAAQGWQVKKGETGTPVQYWKFSELQDKEDENGRPILGKDGKPEQETVMLDRPKVFWATVFNAQQIDGIPERVIQEPSWNTLDRAESLLQASGATIRHDQSDNAFYRPSTDNIHMPPRENFPDAGKYYATSFHELGHWTGHPSRLDRDLSHPFGSMGYAKEELRAEISSMILGDELGIGHDPGQHVAYVGSWIKALQEDPLEIFRAAADAEKIRGFVLAFEQQQVQEQPLAERLAQQEAVQQGYIDSGNYAAAALHREKVLDGLRAEAEAVAMKVQQTKQIDKANLERVLVAVSRGSDHALDKSELNQIRNAILIAADARMISPQSFTEAVIEGFNVNIPADWSGLVNVEGVSANTVTPGVQTETFNVYAQRVDGTRELLANFQHNDDAQDMADRLSMIDAINEQNAPLQAVKLAQLYENSIRRDPNATEEQILAAEQARKNAQNSALVSATSNTAKTVVPQTPSQLLAEVEALKQAATPAARYEALLAQGGRLIDRLEVSKLMSRADAAFTDARRDVFSMSVDPEGDRKLFLEAGERAFGVQIPSDWTGSVTIRGMRNGEPFDRTAGIDPDSYVLEVGSSEGKPNSVIGTFRSPSEALAVADRLMLIDTYSQHGASNLHAISQLQSDLELRRVDTRLQLYSSTSYEGYDPLDSWRNLQQSAERVGLSAGIRLGDTDKSQPDFLVSYQNQNGTRSPITTELYSDGKAVSLVDGKRQDGKGLTSDLVWQREALEEAQHLVSVRPQQEQKMEQKAPAVPGKTYLHVPFKDKDEAKALGARWDGRARAWFINSDADAAPFAKWTSPPKQETTSEIEPGLQAPVQAEAAPVATPRAERTYLAVPYGERNAAKAQGAMWDKGLKSWYITANDDPAKFQRWDPALVATRPTMSPTEEFALACKDHGLKLDGEPIMDGKRHRVALIDDKPGEKSGVYIGHIDGHPAGYIKNHRTGVELNWKSSGQSISDEERAKIHAEAADKLHQRETERAEKYEEQSVRANNMLGRAKVPSEQTPYLINKGIPVHPGIHSDSEGKTTFIPAYDVDGKIWTLQAIQEDGTKRFLKDSKKEGCFHVIGGLDQLEKAPVIVIGEGYATMGTATEALGYATVAAFDSGNLKAVATMLKERYPDKPLLFVGDDDVAAAAKSPTGINAGRSKAEEAAKALLGVAVFPVFAPGEAKNGLSDFNDLAKSSSLGMDAVTRQLKTAEQQAFHRHSDLRASQRVVQERTPRTVKI